MLNVMYDINRKPAVFYLFQIKLVFTVIYRAFQLSKHTFFQHFTFEKRGVSNFQAKQQVLK